MGDDRSVLRWISWRDCCPWLVLLRTFWISVSVRALLLATLGTVLVSLGWWLAGLLLLDRDADYFDPALRQSVARYEAWPGQPVELVVIDPRDMPAASWTGVDLSSTAPVLSVWRSISEPVIQWFNRRQGFGSLAYYCLGGLWTLVVWCFAGGALSRIGIVQLGRDERVGLVESVTYARKRFLSYVGGPLFPIIGIVLLAVPIVILGWIMRFDVGVVVAGVLWLLVILDGLVMALLAIGIFFGWPLMWGTISAESSDAFDSLSRCFAYTFQRPLQYAFYILVSVLFGFLCWVIVSLFAHFVIHLTFWAAAWGAGQDRIDSIDPSATAIVSFTMEDPTSRFSIATGSNDSPTTAPMGTRLIHFWVGCVRAVAASWQYAFFFITMAGVYLLVRRDVDQTETDEVFVEEGDELYDMPPLKTDEAGVPQAADMPEDPAGEKSNADGSPPPGGDQSGE